MCKGVHWINSVRDRMQILVEVCHCPYFIYSMVFRIAREFSHSPILLQVASYMRAVLRTLAVMHSHHILHRDIKPE